MASEQSMASSAHCSQELCLLQLQSRLDCDCKVFCISVLSPGVRWLTPGLPNEEKWPWENSYKIYLNFSVLLMGKTLWNDKQSDRK